jgi:hypothetical protein
MPNCFANQNEARGYSALAFYYWCDLFWCFFNIRLRGYEELENTLAFPHGWAEINTLWKSNITLHDLTKSRVLLCKRRLRVVDSLASQRSKFGMADFFWLSRPFRFPLLPPTSISLLHEQSSLTNLHHRLLHLPIFNATWHWRLDIHSSRSHCCTSRHSVWTDLLCYPCAHTTWRWRAPGRLIDPSLCYLVSTPH